MSLRSLKKGLHAEELPLGMDMEKINRIVDQRELSANRIRFNERIEIYRGRGLDFIAHREWLLKWAGPFMRGEILELGCGNGYMALVMARSGKGLVSIDRSPDTFRVAALNLGYENLLDLVKFVQCDAASLPFADCSIDSVVAVGFFHHASSGDRIIAEVDRVLKRGGNVLISDFNDDGLAVIADVHLSEGRTHESEGAGEEDVRREFFSRGYYMEGAGHPFHWSLLCKKV